MVLCVDRPLIEIGVWRTRRTVPIPLAEGDIEWFSAESSKTKPLRQKLKAVPELVERLHCWWQLVFHVDFL